MQEGFNEDSLFAAVFPAINHYFEEVVVEIGEDFSVIHDYITLFVNNLYFKVSLTFLILSFILKTAKEDISK